MNHRIAPSTAPWVVLDTNTVLDWLVFADPGVAALATAVTEGRVRWLACERMRQEFERVLDYDSLKKWKPDRERVLASFDTASYRACTPPAAPPSMRCTDPDDQVFVDLALSCGARWLVSHDRCLLKLARRARTRALRIVRPVDWRLMG